MTDNEIIKALECCLSSNDLMACWKCPAVKLDICCDGSTKISNGIVNSVLDLINRQEAEIERLTKANERFAEEFDSYYASVKRKAYKEFSEELRQLYDEYDDYDDIYAHRIRDDIDFLVAEMTEDVNEQES